MATVLVCDGAALIAPTLRLVLPNLGEDKQVGWVSEAPPTIRIDRSFSFPETFKHDVAAVPGAST